MATITSVSISCPRVFANGSDSPQKIQSIRFLPMSRLGQRYPSLVGLGRMVSVRPVYATPDRISEKVEESIKTAEQACSENPVSSECAAAWDDVEELSAAASHAREKQKLNSDPLENYCKDNPETDECRTYDN